MMSRSGLSPAFDLSRASYFLDFLLVPIAVAALALFQPITPWMTGLGFLVWTLAEYWIAEAKRCLR